MRLAVKSEKMNAAQVHLAERWACVMGARARVRGKDATNAQKL